MKSYTDIEQSKELAKIPPIESADMCWVTDEIEPLWGVVKSEPDDDFDVIPCWSLAELLDILPKRYNDDNVYMPLVGRYYEGNHKFICGYFGDGLMDWTFGETPVDACYEMILKLKGNNMI